MIHCLLLELVKVYENSESVVLDTLIAELFSSSGKQWAILLGSIKKYRKLTTFAKN